MIHICRARLAFLFVLGCPLLASAATGKDAPKEGQAESEKVGPDALTAMSLEQLMQVRIETVYGASKYQQKVTRAPASVTVVTGDEIARFGHRTLADVLRSIRGVYVSDDRNYSYLGTRGFLRPGDYNSRVLMLIDGHRMNDAIYDGGYVGREGLLSVDLIDRVEFIRGPSSSIYGSSAFFGVVNVITRRGDDSTTGRPEIAVSGGSHSEYEARATYADVLKHELEVSLTAAYYSSDGNRHLYFPELDPAISSDVRAANRGVASGLDGEEAYGFSGRISHGDFTLAAALQGRSKDVPTASFGTLFNTKERTYDGRDYLELQYNHVVAPDLRVLGRASFDRYTYDGDYPFDGTVIGEAPSDTVINKDEALATWLETEWQVTKTIAGRHTLVAGALYRQNLRQDQWSYYETDPRQYLVDDDRRERNSAIYAQGEFALTDQVLLNGGLRYDDYADSFGGTLNPRVGLIYSPAPQSTFKLLYGEAFRAPSAYERFYYLAPPGTPSLQPETIRTHEIVFEQYLGQASRVNVSLFQYSVSGLISQLVDENDAVYYANGTRVNARGAEIEAETKFANGAFARASHTFQKTEDVATRHPLTSSPRHLAKLNVGVPLGTRFDAAAEMQYQSAVATLAGERAKGFVLANLTLTASSKARDLQFSLGLYNLFDTRYGYPGSEDHVQDVISLDGRTFRAKLLRRF